jgi:hypothetical protein
VQWPDLEAISELNSNFKMPSQKASPTIEDGCKIFTQTLRVSNNNVKRIPSISLAYFDAAKGTYAVAATQPIELDVEETKVLTAADVEGQEPTSVSKQVEAVREGLSANYEQLDALENVGFSALAAVVSPGYLSLWALPLLVLISSAALKVITHDSPERQARRRRRNACPAAVARLKKAQKSEGGERLDDVALAVRQYVADRFDGTAASLTAEECYEIVRAACGDAESAAALRDILSQCETARYASSQHEVKPEQIEATIKTIKQIDKKIKR